MLKLDVDLSISQLNYFLVVAMNIIWDDVFLTGKIKSDLADDCEVGSRKAKAFACATALCGWANCMVGSSPPENFDNGLLALAKFGDIDLMTIGSPEKISALAKELNLHGEEN